MTATDTQLVDENVVYASPADVFRHIRNKGYEDLPNDRSGLSQGGLAKSDVDSLIRQASERVDRHTKRAWRTRKVSGVELDINLSHDQKHARHRRRRTRGHGGRHNYQYGTRAMVDLPHTHIKPIDPSTDSVEILNPRSSTDITEDEGREDGRYIVSNRKGILRPDIDNLTPIGTYHNGPTIEEGVASVRVTYRYGHPNDVTDYTEDGDSVGVSDYVPPDIRDAVGQLAASRLIASDQYGELVPSGGDGSPNLGQASSRIESDAMKIINEYRRV